MKIRFVTDSGSDIGFDYADKLGVKVVPLSITFSDADDVVLLEDRSFDLNGYYKKYEEVDNFTAKTAQPTPRDFFKVYEELGNEGAEDIVVVTLSSGLSGTINSARLGSKMYSKINDKVRIHLVDALNASYAEVFLIEKGIRLREEGKSAEDIVEILQTHTKNLKTYILLPSLKYLHKGGRISVTKYILGTLLRKKPITKVNNEGKNVVAASVTEIEEGVKKIIELTTDNFTKKPKKVAIVHGNCPEKAKLLEKAILDVDNKIEVKTRCTGVTISAHTGPDVIALLSEF